MSKNLGKTLHTNRLGIACATFSLLIVAPAVASTDPIRTVALYDQQAPDLPVGLTLRTVQPNGAIDATGQVSFYGFLNGPGLNLDNDEGIWAEAGGSIHLVARQGSHAAGTPDAVLFQAMAQQQLRANARTQFYSYLTGPGIDTTNNMGIWWEEGGSLNLLARAGNPAVGLPGFKYDNMVFVDQGPDGHTLFGAGLVGSGVTLANDVAMWAGEPANPQLIVREGANAPGTAAGVVFNSIFPAMLDAAGNVAFLGRLTGSGVNSTNNNGIWSNGSGNLAMLIRAGQQAPGTPVGAVFSDVISTLSGPVVNGTGQIAFLWNLSGTGVDTTNDRGIWSNTTGSFSLVARKGGHAPGTPLGVSFGLLEQPKLNNSGQVLFHAPLTGANVDTSNDSGLWAELTGGLSLIAREGNQAPGTPVGTVFSSIDQWFMNTAGQVAFNAILSGPGVDGFNNRGIWLSDPNGIVQLIARTGGSLVYGTTDMFTTGGVRVTALTDSGRMLFVAGTTRGTGAFILDLAAIPEPHSLLLATIGFLGTLTRRRSIRVGRS